MKKFKIAISLFAVIAMLATMLCFTSAAAPASSTVQSSEGFSAVPYMDGVLLSWSIPTANNAPQSYGWYEIAVCEETEPVFNEAQAGVLSGEGNTEAIAGANVINESQWGMNGTAMQKYLFRYCFKLNRNSHSFNNSLFTMTAFINEDSVLNLDGSWNANVPAADRTKNFENTPGKTYYFYILGVNSNRYYALGRIVYTVPSNPTLSVESDGLTNTLTYTLNKGKDGAIYRYDSEDKAQAGGNDYDKKITVSYGGAPVTDTVTDGGNYYYVLKQDISSYVEPRTGKNGTETAATEITYDLTGVTVKFNFDQPERVGQCVNVKTNLINICSGGNQGAEHISTCPGNHNGGPFGDANARLWLVDDGITDNGMNLLTDTVRFTFDNTEPVTYTYRDMGGWGTNAATTTKLMPGVTYYLALTQTNPGNQYVGSYATITVPWYLSSAVATATNVAPSIPEETETVIPEETETIIPEESEAATEAPSTIPSDDPNNGGDISLVLYAVTALTAGGAIVAIKRRKA